MSTKDKKKTHKYFGKKIWSKEEESKLLHYKELGKTEEEIAQLLERTPGAVRTRSEKLSKPPLKKAHSKWSKEEENNLLHYEKLGKTVNEIAQLLERTPSAVRRRIQKINDDKQTIQEQATIDWQKWVADEPINELNEQITEQHAIIFDLDMTLIDTSALIELRENRRWKEVYDKFELTHLYPHARKLITHYGLYYKVGVVTSSPRTYAEKLLEYHNLDIPVITAYHDTKNHKPSPDPLLHAIKKMDLNPMKDIIITIGDEVSDIKAAVAVNETFGINPKKYAPFPVDFTFKSPDPEEFNPYIHRWHGNYHDNGMNPYCVAWGLDSTHKLIDSGAMYIIYQFDELLEMFGAGYGLGENPPDVLLNESKIPNINDHWHIINYFPANTQYHDDWCKSIIELKKGNYRIVKKWGKLILEQIDWRGWYDSNAEFYDLIKSDTLIIRALSSDETNINTSDPHPLDEICEIIAYVSGASYAPQIMKKKHPSRQLKYLNKNDRINEIKDNYYCELPDNWVSAYGEQGKNKILIVDDILTTGLTASSIAKELKNVFPNSSISLLTLGKTSNPKFGGPSDNSHMEGLIKFFQTEDSK